MNWMNRLTALEKKLLGEKIWHNQSYYRFRKNDSDIYELAILIPGPCGDSSYAPRLTFTIEDHQILFLTYYDNHRNPIESSHYSEELNDFFTNKFEGLLLAFEEL